MKTKDLFNLNTWSISTPYADYRWQFLADIFGKSIMYVPLWKGGKPTIEIENPYQGMHCKRIQPDLVIFMLSKRLYIVSNDVYSKTEFTFQADEPMKTEVQILREDLMKNPFKGRLFGFLLYWILKIKLYNLKRKKHG